MIKLSFTVGAGKGNRAKYHEQLPKFVRASLQSIGFVEDKGACCMRNCAGMFKYQHDTGKNFIYIRVFPKLTEQEAKAGGDEDSDDAGDGGNDPMVGPRGLCASCDVGTFQEMTAAQTPTWSQKKRLLGVLQDLRKQVHEMEAKLMRGQALTEADQELYGSIESLDDKMEWLQASMKATVKAGNITSSEKAALVDNVERKLGLLAAETEAVAAKLAAGGKPKLQKRAARLAAETEKTAKRLEGLQNKKTVSILKLLPLRHVRDMEDCWERAGALRRVAGGGGGGGMSMKEQKAAFDLENLERKFEKICVASMSSTWFESNESFEERLGLAKQKWQANSAPRRAGAAAAAAAAGGGRPGRRTAPPSGAGAGPTRGAPSPRRATPTPA